jgi:hypothetical protein
VLCNTPELCWWLRELLTALLYPVAVLAIFTLLVIIYERFGFEYGPQPYPRNFVGVHYKGNIERFLTM